MSIITTQSLDKKRKLTDGTKKAFSSANIVPSKVEFKPKHVRDFLVKEGYVKDKKETKKSEQDK
jgi:hypothetical protein